jgi:hypothetical protein
LSDEPRVLAPEEIDALRKRHVPDPEEDDPEFWWCAACSSFNDGPEGWAIFVDWPCDAANLLATLDAALVIVPRVTLTAEQRDELKAKLLALYSGPENAGKVLDFKELEQ